MIWTLLNYIDTPLFVYCIFTVVYLLVFVLASNTDSTDILGSSKTKKTGRFLFITTACHYDNNIEQTIKSILTQEYDEKLFDLVVVSDHLPSVTNMKLAQYPITLLRTNYDNGNKIKAIQYAIENMPPLKVYDMAILIDPDETIGSNFLSELNKSLQAGSRFIQAHRIDRNDDSPYAILAKTFEEINNSIFRIGHNNLGFSSALIGSGLCIDYTWFRENVNKLSSSNEEKEMEMLLLEQKIFVDYIEGVQIYVEHMKKRKDFNAQRRRWTRAQAKFARYNYRKLIPAIINKNYDLADKIFQWILIPRIVLVGIIAFMCLFLPLVYWTLAIKWWFSALLLMFVFALAIPDYIVNEKWIRSFRYCPVIIVSSLISLFTWPHRRNKTI